MKLGLAILLGLSLGIINLIAAIKINKWGLKKPVIAAQGIIMGSVLVRLTLSMVMVFFLSRLLLLDFVALLLSFVIAYTLALAVEAALIVRFEK